MRVRHLLEEATRVVSRVQGGRDPIKEKRALGPEEAVEETPVEVHQYRGGEAGT